MSGLFEDDSNVRPVKEPKKPSQPKARSTASKIIKKVEEKSILVQAASGKGKVVFEQIDVKSIEKSTERAAKKADNEKIEPLINYVSDSNG